MTVANQFDRSPGNLIPVSREKLEPVLFGIYKGESLRKMAGDMSKSIRTIQDVLATLEKKGYLVKKTQNGKKGGRFLTEKGKEFLRKNGHSIP